MTMAKEKEELKAEEEYVGKCAKVREISAFRISREKTTRNKRKQHTHRWRCKKREKNKKKKKRRNGKNKM